MVLAGHTQFMGVVIQKWRLESPPGTLEPKYLEILKFGNKTRASYSGDTHTAPSQFCHLLVGNFLRVTTHGLAYLMVTY